MESDVNLLNLSRSTTEIDQLILQNNEFLDEIAVLKDELYY
jgi:hypothetical protein